jgi:antitoxin ParD1/3/4
MPRSSRTITPSNLRKRVEDALADPRPNVPAREVFKRLRDHHAKQVKAKRQEKVRSRS